MKKKHLTNTMLISAAMLSAVCFLNGCAVESTSTVAIPRQPKQQQEDENESSAVKETSTEAEKTVTPDTKTENLSYDALNEFSYKLFAENMSEENPVLSPVSAYMALAMAGLGAQNNTKAEFETVFGDFANITGICDNLMTTLPTASKTNTVSLANSAWIAEGFPIHENWILDVNTKMHSEVFQRNLTTTETMDSINQWIKENTNGLIDKMLDKPLNGQTGLALFNTIYFKAKWADSFEAYSVYPDTFYLENGNELETELMHKESELDYMSNEFVEGLIFPYINTETQDGNFSFVALKPVDQNTTVRELYKKLTPSVIKELLKNKVTQSVNTKLPKFELEFDKELNESLKNMGLRDAFNIDTADFGNIADLNALDGNLYISLVRQKAKIIVDEEGTEAAAATEAIMECGAALPIDPPKEVFFDRPFVYMIMDMEKEVPLFIGILDSPAACGKQS